MGFKETQPKQLPKWLTGQDASGHSEGIAFAQTFGATKDTELALLKEAVKVRWPGSAPDDALTLLGRDRVILQAPIESNAAYRVRLASPHDMWLWGGTHTGFIDRFAPYGYTAVAGNIKIWNNCETVWDSNTAWFSRVFVLLEIGAFNVDKNWGSSGNYDDGFLWDSNISIADVDYFRKSLRAWKSDPAYPVVIGVALGGGALTDDGFWSSSGSYNDGGNWNDSVIDITYVKLAECWGEEAWLSPGGGPGCWDEEGDVWGDYVPPTGGWVLPFCP